MQYSKCIECKNDGNMCKFIIVDALMAINNIEFLTNILKILLNPEYDVRMKKYNSNSLHEYSIFFCLF